MSLGSSPQTGEAMCDSRGRQMIILIRHGESLAQAKKGKARKTDQVGHTEREGGGRDRERGGRGRQRHSTLGGCVVCVYHSLCCAFNAVLKSYLVWYYYSRILL
jgi:hypothetical protein